MTFRERFQNRLDAEAEVEDVEVAADLAMDFRGHPLDADPAGRIPVLLDGMDEDPLGPDELPFHADEQGASEESSETLLRQAARGEMTLRELEDRYVDLTLERTGGNKVQAARILGLDRKTLYRWALRREDQQS